MPLRWGASLRGRKVFHPNGVLANGVVERVAPPGEGLPVESCDVVARVSKGVGTPGALPDLVGLALKMPPSAFAASAWDVLMVSSGSGLLTRFSLRPALSWGPQSLSTLMPYEYDGKYWWLRAGLTTDIDAQGLSLDAIRRALADGEVTFDLDQACGTNGFTPLARVTLTEPMPDDQSVSFDPTLHAPPGIRLAPGWLTGLRRQSYDRSREGRDAD